MLSIPGVEKKKIIIVIQCILTKTHFRMFWKTEKSAGVVDSPDSVGLLYQGRIKGLQVGGQGAYLGSAATNCGSGHTTTPQALVSAS